MTPSDRQRRFAAALIAVVLATGTVAARASSQPMIEPDRVALSVRGAAVPDAMTMRAAIIEGGTLHAWRLVGEEPGRLVLRVAYAEHSATVGVSYDAAGFQIQYQDSTAMDYELSHGQRLINPRYNNWVAQLGNAIRRVADNAMWHPRRFIIDTPTTGAASAASVPGP